MSFRFAWGAAILLLLAGPAYADCQEEIGKVEQAMVAAETGAAASESGMPATEHQSELLREEQTPTGSAAPSDSSTTGSSEHQEEAIKGEESENGRSMQAEKLVEEAKQHEEEGDEQACLQKVQEAKSLLGME